jgi:hypothetical protein
MFVSHVDISPGKTIHVVPELEVESGYFEDQKFQTVEMLECNVDPLMQNPIRYCHNLQHPKFRAQKESLGNLVSKTLHVILLTTISDDQTPMSKL